MINLCTVSDNNYLAKGLTLYESLKRFSNNFKLHYLCTDHATYTKVNSVSITEKSVQAHYAEAIPELCMKSKSYKHQHTSEYTTRQHYFWSLSSRFSHWLLSRIDAPNITYLDSDLMLFNDISIVLKEFEESDAPFAVTPHLHNTEMDAVGAYNIAMVTFRKAGGMDTLNMWKDLVCDPSNKYYRKYGTCGDQKYFDLLVGPYGGHIYGRNFCQVAPWNFRLYDETMVIVRDRPHLILRDRAPMCDKVTTDKALPLISCHYSHFEPAKNGAYVSGTKNYGNFFVSSWVHDIYEQYNEEMVKVMDKYGIN